MIKLVTKIELERKKMCNQFKVPTLSDISKYLKSDLNLPLTTPSFTLDKEEDIYPNTEAPVLLYQDNKLQLVMKKWGYPSPVDNKKPIFNARIERFYDAKPSMWDQSFAKQRCLIISKEFFESSKKTYQANGRTYHERFAFKNPAAPLTLIAGIYDQDHFSMVTTAPNKWMKPIHNRMPLVIAPTELRRWLFQNFTSLIDRQDFTLEVTKQNKIN